MAGQTRGQTPYNSPLHGRYLVRNPAWRAWLGAADAALALRSRAAQPPVATPRRLLVAVGGHIGDAVIATSVLPLLARAFPGVELGLLLGSWSRAAVEDHPLVARVHVADHWRLDRRNDALPLRLARWRRTRLRAAREIREAGYDAAVDLSAYYPNMAALLHRAGVPVRAGWTSGGYAPLYTHAVDWTGGARHTAEQHVELLRAVWPASMADVEEDALAYALPPVDASADRRARTTLAARGIGGDYVVVHPGTGDARKAWPAERWREVARALAADGRALAFTGVGESDKRAVADATRGVPGAVDLVEKLGWAEFRAVLAGARLVLTVDTVAAHLAAADGVPCVVVRASMSDARHWRPLGRDVTVLSRDVPCAPCFRSRGCAAMTCVRDVGVDDVVTAARGWLSRMEEQE